ncbi:MaoC/PaaZ C-terminal domain-containing protein [Jiella sonneratiae]|uniref:MaoC family dehydratase n=1 Tax=Jiella sonneratiae TaxID=2816856 RepID=A0ABS3J255_9HYPH|nr:MaoC family dehydratase [Jiella sonneratiae]
MAQELYFDDLDVGRRFESEPFAVTAEAIKAFAESYDPQPFHLDENAAADGFFGGLVASGWHVAALTMRRFVLEGLPVAGGLIGAGAELQWLRATRPGDTLRVFSEILECRPSRSRPTRGTVTIRSETRNQHGAVVQVMTTRIVVPRREPA